MTPPLAHFIRVPARGASLERGAVSHQAGDKYAAVRQPALDLAAAYVELQNLVLDGPDVAAFPQQLATLSAALVPLTSCGVTIRRDHGVATTGSSDQFAMQLDEIQSACGHFDDSDIRRAESFTRQAATVLTLMLRLARQAEQEDQLLEALATRAVIDQAMGIVMAQRQISSVAAFGVLREASQNSNRKLSIIAAELIEATTGNPPLPPRPFTKRDLPERPLRPAA